MSHNLWFKYMLFNPKYTDAHTTQLLIILKKRFCPIVILFAEKDRKTRKRDPHVTDGKRQLQRQDRYGVSMTSHQKYQCNGKPTPSVV